jgi:RNA polymerase sigma-70 factor (ECF subfamily)
MVSTQSGEPEIGDAVRRFAEGDATAAEFLARRACRLALRTTAAILGRRDGASDIAQDVAVDVLRSVGQLRNPETFDAWVHRITVRYVMRTLRRHRVTRRSETPLELVSERDEPIAPEAVDQADVLAARAALAAGLVRLPPKQRLALALRYVHDLSDTDIATALDCRLGTVHALLSRGRAALRRDPRLAELAPVTEAGGSR